MNSNTHSIEQDAAEYFGVSVYELLATSNLDYWIGIAESEAPRLTEAARNVGNLRTRISDLKAELEKIELDIKLEQNMLNIHNTRRTNAITSFKNQNGVP